MGEELVLLVLLEEEEEDIRILNHENDCNGKKIRKVAKSKTLRYCAIHYCVVQSKCSYIIMTLQTNRRLHSLLKTRQMIMLNYRSKQMA